MRPSETMAADEEQDSVFHVKRTNGQLIIKLSSNYIVGYFDEIKWVIKSAPIFLLIGVAIFAAEDCKDKGIASVRLAENFYFGVIVIPIVIALTVVVYMTWGLLVSRDWSLSIVNTQSNNGPPRPEVQFRGVSLVAPATVTMTVQQFPEPDSESEASPAYWAELHLMNADEDSAQTLLIKTPQRGDFSAAQQDGKELQKLLQKELLLR